MCKTINHWPTEWTSFAERAILRELQGGCSIPVGARSKLDIADDNHSGILTLTGCVTALDGSAQVEHTLTETVRSREEAEAVGTKLGGILLASGARIMIDGIREAQDNEAALK
jgi:hydroxymethylbilane synthase